jgi:hypothetical protein
MTDEWRWAMWKWAMMVVAGREAMRMALQLKRRALDVERGRVWRLAGCGEVATDDVALWAEMCRRWEREVAGSAVDDVRTRRAVAGGGRRAGRGTAGVRGRAIGGAVRGERWGEGWLRGADGGCPGVGLALAALAPRLHRGGLLTLWVLRR